MNLNNLILDTDSYKPSQFPQYPAGTTKVQSYIEPRKGEFTLNVFAGLQPYVMKVLMTPITMADVEEAAEFLAAHGEPCNVEGWKYIVEKHNGYLPLQIDALPEGTVHNNRVMQVRVTNTDPNCYWVTSYIETALLRAVWYMSTVATVSFNIKRIILKYLQETGDVEGLPFKLHDFGARGVSSFESAGLGGLGHIMNFMGTDTMTAILFAKKFYGATDMPAFSIPASEHSTITSWGREGEVEAYRNMLNLYAKPGSILACVSDSYDIYNAAKNLWGGTLKQQIIDSGATLVVRPDSGDPVTVVADVVRILDEQFGSTVNAKGYKVLNNVRVIQGDGITAQTIENILATLKGLGYSADNIAFGVGGALLQASTRDTQAYAMKACAAEINGEWVDVFKDPVTDKNKQSKKGRLVTIARAEDGVLETVPMAPGLEEQDVMRVVYCKTETMDKPSVFIDNLAAIRDRLNKYARKDVPGFEL